MGIEDMSDSDKGHAKEAIIVSTALVMVLGGIAAARHFRTRLDNLDEGVDGPGGDDPIGSS